MYIPADVREDLVQPALPLCHFFRRQAVLMLLPVFLYAELAPSGILDLFEHYAPCRCKFGLRKTGDRGMFAVPFVHFA
jgi:hypothetical protein